MIICLGWAWWPHSRGAAPLLCHSPHPEVCCAVPSVTGRLVIIPPHGPSSSFHPLIGQNNMHVQRGLSLAVGATVGAFFRAQAEEAAHSHWQIVQVAETSSPGEAPAS